MFDSNILDVLIGIVFVFLLLSAATSWFTELVAHILRLRSHHLKQYLIDWIDEDPDYPFVDKLYDSKVIGALFKSRRWREGPSFISPSDFVSGVIEAALTTDGNMAADVQADVNAYIKDKLPKSIQYPVMAFVNDLAEPVVETEKEVVSLRTHLENWFDSAMDRCVGEYKRKVYWVGLIGAFVLAFAANVDTVAITKALWDNQDLRLQVASAAIDYIDTVPLPEESDDDTGDPLEEASAAADMIEEILLDMEELEVPIFWELGDVTGEDIYNQNLGHVLDDPGLLLPKIMGLSMTALAASFGSPMWFDLLKQLVNLRSTGPKPGEQSKANGNKK